MPEYPKREPSEYLEPWEFAQQFDALKPKDLAAITSVALSLAGDGHQYEPQELISEVVVRTMKSAGDDPRRCPRNVTIPAYVIEAMRSIMKDAWRAEKRERERNGKLSQLAEAREFDTPEYELELREAREQFLRHFSDDPEALEVLIRLLEGHRGKQACAGMDPAIYARARNKIRKKLLKYYAYLVKRRRK